MKREAKHSFAENIDYSNTGTTSTWGEGDKEVLELLKHTQLRGQWLNLAAGDGRYNTILLRKTDEVVATDIDQNALNKLVRNTPENLRGKLKTQTFDITEPFPFENNSLDGVFCTGTLHFFAKDQLDHIVKEIDRVLKPGGQLIIDFATDVKRVLPNGELYRRENETQRTQKEAKELLKSLLQNYSIDIIESRVPEEKVTVGNITYTFSCNFLLISVQKKD